jgi:hypothetical protein
MKRAILFALLLAAAPAGVRADQVIADDLIVQGSTCVGLDCVVNESFGFDTLRLKENNTRIKFEDTSTGAFPTHDWQLTANDSASGGAEKFSIEDVTAATVPFTITGSAPNNSIFVDSTGRLGLRTSAPVLDVHVATSNTPGMRYEQTNAGGFVAQTWDVAGNEANFFVRDVTGGSRLPFRIRPGAPTSSIDIAASGNVGIGTASPGADLDVASSGVAATIRISTTGTTVPATWDLKNNQDTGRLTITDDATGLRVPFKLGVTAVNNLLRVGVLATNTVDINGNLFVTGTITPDYVFDKQFEVPSIEEHAALMWQKKHLPRVEAAVRSEEGKDLINVGARSQGVLEELEYAHVYIEQLQGSIKELQIAAEHREDELVRLHDEIESIKKAMAAR